MDCFCFTNYNEKVGYGLGPEVKDINEVEYMNFF